MLPLDYSKSLFDNIIPVFSYNKNEDIIEGKNAAKEKLIELLGLHKIKQFCTSNNITIEYDEFAKDLGCREIRFLVESEKDVFVPCHLFIPKYNLRQSLIVALHGHCTGMHILAGRKKYQIDFQTINEQNCDFAKQAINNGFAVLTFEHRGFGERGGNDKGAQCSELSLRTMLAGRTLIGDRVFDAINAIDAVYSNFSEDISCKETICIGYSGGGTIALYLSALYEKIHHTVIVSAISTFKDSIGAMPHCACNYVPNIVEYFDMGDICQLIAPRALTIISGKEDKIFPLSGAKESINKAMDFYSAHNARDKLTHIIAREGHKFYPEEVWNCLNAN